MEEEKKEVVEEAQEVKEEEKVAEPEPVEEQQAAGKVDDEADVKYALNAFIAAMIGIVLFETGIGMFICGLISKNIQKKIQGQVEKKPHKVFLKIASIAAKIEIIAGIIIFALIVLGFLIWLIWFIIVVVIAAGAAAEGAIAVLPLL